MIRFFITLILTSICLGSFSQNTKAYTASDRFYKKGIELLEKERYVASIHFLEKYISHHPDALNGVDAMFAIVYAEMQLEQKHAPNHLFKFIQDNETHPSVEVAHFESGMFSFKHADYKNAITHLTKVPQSYLDAETSFEYNFALGYSYLLLKEFDEALTYFERLDVGTNKYQSAAKYYAAYIYFKQKKFEQAVANFKILEDNQTYGAVVPFMITNILYHQDKFTEVISYGEEIIESKKKILNKNEIILLVGSSHYELSNYTETLNYLNPYVKSKGGSSSTLYRLAYAAFITKDYTLASNYFEKFATDNDSIGQAGAYYLGHSYIKQGKKDFALNTFVLASSQDFDTEIQAQAMLNEAKLYYEAKNFHKAIATVKRLNKDFPEFKFEAPKNEILSEAYLNSNNLDEAISYIDGLKNPNKKVKAIYKEVTYLKGVNLFNRKEYKEAISYFTKSRKTSGDNKFNRSAVFWRAEALSLLFDWPKAYEDYEYVLKNTKKDNLYYREALYGKAYTVFNKLIGEDVKDSELRKRMNSGRYETCRELFSSYVKSVKNKKKDKYYEDALVRLADCYYINHDYKNALENYQYAIKEKSKSSAYAQFQLGKVYSFLEDYDASTQSYDMVISKYPSSLFVEEAMYSKAKNYYAIGQYSRSIPYFNDYLVGFSTTVRRPVVLLERAVAYLNVKKHKLALEDFDEVLYTYCTDTVYSSQALRGAQESLNFLNQSEEYEKRLEQYFKCGGKGEERLRFEAARDNYRNKNYELSIKQLERFAREYPSSVFSYEVFYYLGMDYYEYDDKGQAERYLKKVIDSDEKFHFEEALIILSGIYLEGKQWEKANEVNRVLLSLTKTANKQLIILLELIEGHFKLEEYEESSVFVERVLASEVHLIYAVNKARLYKGKIAFIQNRLDDALDEFVLLSNDSKDHYGAEAHYMVGKIQYQNGDYLEALETLKNLLELRQDDLFWYGEGYILASQCYIALGEEFQGKAYLKDVISNFPEPLVVEHAKNVLSELETAKKIEDEK